MTKFAYLFVGGLVKDDEREQNMKDWTNWIGKLGQKLVDGAPFGDKSKRLDSPDDVKTYDWKKHSNVGGYCIVETTDLNEAVELVKDCPQFAYGNGSVEVREIMAM